MSRLPVMAIAALVAASGLYGLPAEAAGCTTADSALLATVEAKVERHANETGRTDLHEMFSRSLQTMKGNDDYTTSDIKARPDKQGDKWQGAGPNELWQKVYSELDRLETCRASLQADTTPPVITLTGSGTVTIQKGVTYTDAGATCVDNTDGAISPVRSGTVDTQTAGSYTITYSCTDAANNAATQVSRVVTVQNPPDTTPPVITLTGSGTVTIQKGVTYTDAGATCTDDTDGTISPISSGTVDTTTAGSYTITYSCTDAANNAATQVSRVVTVQNPPDTTPPVITLTGSGTVTIQKGVTYTDAGATCTDDTDGTISPISSGTVDTTTAGSYTITYSCTDAANNAATQVSRVVTVQNPLPPSFKFLLLTVPQNITEGEPATFTLTSTPAPSSPLDVVVNVQSPSGHLTSAETGNRTVTIPASGSANFTIHMVNTPEAKKGTLVVNVPTPAGYTAGPGINQLGITDDPRTPAATPTVSIAAGSDITEGGSATFTITASPAPTTPLTISLTVSQSGDYAVSGSTGAKTVTMPTGGSATYTVATIDDTADEADGSVSVTIGNGNGYSVGTTSSGTVSISDNDDAPATPWWTPILSAAEPTEHSVSLLVPSGNEVLVGWPQKADYKQYNVRATSFEGHDTRWIYNHTGYWWVFADLEPGTWLFMVYDAKGFQHSDMMFLEVPEDGQAGQVLHNVKISGAGSINEGQEAIFTLTASPQPATPLDVTVTISQSGGYAATTGSRTVTIPTSGNTTFGVATIDDRVYEADGSVTAWLSGAGQGYVGTGNREAVIKVSDNDVPEVKISAGTPGMVEGGTAVFVVSTSTELTSPLTISLTVGQDGYWIDTGITGTKTVTIPTSGSTPYRITTINDAQDEANGAIVVALNNGTDYIISDTMSSARTTVWDNDATGTSSCITSDATLLASVESKRDAATDSDLVEMLTRSALTLQGRDMYTTHDIKTLKKDDSTWHGTGPDTFWQKVYAELDRLEVCRGPQVIVIDNTPDTAQSNLAGATVTITAINNMITEGSDAEFTILVTGIPLPTEGLFMVLPKDSSGNSSNDMPQYLKLGSGGTVRLTIPASGLTTLTVPTQDDWTDEEDGQIWVGVDKGGPEGFGSWVKMTVTDNDETLPPSEAKRIPWMVGHWDEVVTNIDHGKTDMHMTVEWGRPQHYRESQANWWSTWINYCIEIVGSTKWTGDGELITSKSVAAQGAGPHCIANLQFPGHQGTDDAYNGGGAFKWIYAKGNTTYTFDIWVQGDKDASKQTFTFTTGDDEFIQGREGCGTDCTDAHN